MRQYRQLNDHAKDAATQRPRRRWARALAAMILRSAALEGSDLYSEGTPAAIGQGLKKKKCFSLWYLVPLGVVACEGGN